MEVGLPQRRVVDVKSRYRSLTLSMEDRFRSGAGQLGGAGDDATAAPASVYDILTTWILDVVSKNSIGAHRSSRALGHAACGYCDIAGAGVLIASTPRGGLGSDLDGRGGVKASSDERHLTVRVVSRICRGRT